MKYSDFEIIKKLGKGAFGTVWLAKKIKNPPLSSSPTSSIINTNTKTNEEKEKRTSPLAIGEDFVEEVNGGEIPEEKRVKDGVEYALKVIYSRKKELEDSFSLGTTLSHPNLMKCYNVFTDSINVGNINTKPHMVTILEYIDGVNLFEATKNPDRALRMKEYLPQIISAVKYLHSNNIVHRDIKPENILIQNENGNKPSGEGSGYLKNKIVKLIDYDFLTVLEPGKKLSMKVGTPYYISPEMYSKQGYDNKVDLWALGVTLYYCMVRDYPFLGENEFELKKSILSSPLNADLIHSQYRDLIVNLLHKDPTQRTL